MLIGSLGYGLAAAAFGVLTLLMLTSWRGRLQGGLLVVAAGLTAVWAAAAAGAAAEPAYWRFVPALEILRNVAWLVFLARLTPAGQGLDGKPRQLAALAPAFFVLAYGFGSAITGFGPEGLPVQTRTLIIIGLVTAISGLVLLEQAFRAMRAGPRRQVLPLIIGVGGILAYDLFLYSHGLLFRGLHQELWAARGYASVLTLPFLLLAARRNPSWSVDIFISRHVALYTTSLMGVGAYLVLMAMAGYVLRFAGGEWGLVLQVVFFFGALVVLAWVIFSPAARAKLKVFIAKHFYSNKYDYREEWLKLTRRLAEGEGTEPLPQRGLGALVELAGAEGGALWVSERGREAEGFRCLATVGTLPSQLPPTLQPADPFIVFLGERRWTVNIAEAHDNPDSHPSLLIPEWVASLGRNALVVPMLNNDRLWGIVALAKPKSVGRLSYEDIDLFRVAGMQIAAVLAQAEADRLLAESRQFEAYNRFAAFIMHDLKNVIAQQSLVVRNAARFRNNPAFIDDALDTVANSVERMQRLLDQLKRNEGAAMVERVDLGRLVLETVNRYSGREPPPTAVFPDFDLKLRIDRERLAAVLGHLVTNAQDATPASGHVRIEAELDDDWVVLAVEDDGEGMEEEFLRERLFRPFDSTKGSKGMGIGAYQARQFVESVGGEVRVRSTPGHGTRFELRFPMALVEGRDLTVTATGAESREPPLNLAGEASRG